MKIAFISDIHGNAVALDAVLCDIKKKQVDKIYVLGDICYRGPEPKRSLQLIQSLNTNVIKGNADEWVVRGVQKGEVPDSAIDMMNTEREWILSNLEKEDIDYLQKLPKELQFDAAGLSIHVFHATPDSLFDVVVPGESDDILKTKLMSSSESDVYVYAHIHKPYIRFINGKVLINIGSVGLPFDGVKKSSYAIIKIEECQISTSIERVEFDVEKVVKQYEQLGYPNQNMVNVIRNARI
ncbi:metallophosphoesterase family protein [Domibacillus epiphyticus]|uniref:YfcE family phosphodiesterase n=1 Tax=Domibacillus epiphyticus TaxID=1714355 RepID=A0A1V2A8I6_9BACI|nr:metallophosphoesterase family protein [Domibacillus epiphyticus]OMP67172.1 YfcE family phosphodiesterase [Domibacillus epiphyticus]